MNASISLPSELWQIILQDVISVPAFLDPDAVETIPPHFATYLDIDWNNEKWYWVAERSRNALRRVCRSWDNHLRKYEHRFIHMVDVVHNFVPVKCLKSAVRVSLGNHNTSFCIQCLQSSYKSLLNFDNYGQVCWLLIGQVQPLRATILDCGKTRSDTLDIKVFFPNLVAFQISAPDHYEGFEDIINSLPNFRHCFSTKHWRYDQDLQITSLSLTTLSFPFVCPFPNVNWFNKKNCHFPALRHLSFTNFHDLWSRSEEYWDSLWALLEVVGKGLRSLYIPDGRGPRDLPEDIWRLCPKLELLYTKFSLKWAPPPEHPLHTISLPTYYMVDRSGHFRQPKLPDWPGIRALRINITWDNYLWMYGQAPKSWNHLRLEDAVGISIEDYTLRNTER
jgi:hypothetical protein